MRKLGTIFLVLGISLSFSNCEALSDALGGLVPKYYTDNAEFGVAPADLGNANDWKFAFGLDLNDKFADQLLKAGGSLKIPGIGTVAGKAGVGGAAMVVAKQREFDGKTYAEFAFLIKLDGDELKTLAQDGFPQPGGAGNYGFFVYKGSDPISFVYGSANGCGGNAGLVVVNDSNKFITETNSGGAYAYPAVGGSAVTNIITDTDCDGEPASVTTGAPTSEKDSSGEPVQNPKASGGDDPDGSSIPDGDDSVAVAENTEGNEDSTNVNVGEAPRPNRGTATAGCHDVITGDFGSSATCEFAAVDSDGVKSSDDPTDATLHGSVNTVMTDKLLLATGNDGSVGSGKTVGSGFAIRAADLTGKTTVKVTYTMVSQEFPYYVNSSFNDAFGMGFSIADEVPELAEKSSVNGLADFWVALNDDGSKSYLSNQWKDTFVTENGYKLVGDVASSGDSGNGTNGYRGISQFSGGTYTEVVSVTIPERFRTANANVVMAIADVGDRWYDSALVIEDVTVE